MGSKSLNEGVLSPYYPSCPFVPPPEYSRFPLGQSEGGIFPLREGGSVNDTNPSIYLPGFVDPNDEASVLEATSDHFEAPECPPSSVFGPPRKYSV